MVLVLAFSDICSTVGKSIWHRREAFRLNPSASRSAWQIHNTNEIERERIALSNSALDTMVMFSTMRKGADSCVRVALQTRASLPQVNHTKVIKEVKDAGIKTVGVALNHMGYYFDIIMPPGTELPTRGTAAAETLKSGILTALPKIYGDRFTFKAV